MIRAGTRITLLPSWAQPAPVTEAHSRPPRLRQPRDGAAGEGTAGTGALTRWSCCSSEHVLWVSVSSRMAHSHPLCYTPAKGLAHSWLSIHGELFSSAQQTRVKQQWSLSLWVVELSAGLVPGFCSARGGWWTA